MGDNGTYAFLIKPSGGMFRKFACPLSKYKLANVTACSSELAIIDGNRTRYVSYPELLVVDNATRTECDPDVNCERYLVDEEVEVSLPLGCFLSR